jgi:hypothetical protein
MFNPKKEIRNLIASMIAKKTSNPPTIITPYLREQQQHHLRGIV